jgi:uncharacterized protein YdeI (YjbR/CyaY-like superfamily)
LRRWFTSHHATAQELWVGYYKKNSGKRSITYPESVGEALCFGWIDGVRKGIDEKSYTNRFSPRKRGSTWSTTNVRRVQALKREGRMHAAGLAAFRARSSNKTRIYSYENRPDELPEPYAGIFRRNRAAWDFFQAQPPGYRRTVTWWVVSAKKEETRLKRLKALIEDSAKQRRIGLLKRKEPAR